MYCIMGRIQRYKYNTNPKYHKFQTDIQNRKPKFNSKCSLDNERLFNFSEIVWSNLAQRVVCVLSHVRLVFFWNYPGCFNMFSQSRNYPFGIVSKQNKLALISYSRSHSFTLYMCVDVVAKCDCAPTFTKRFRLHTTYKQYEYIRLHFMLLTVNHMVNVLVCKCV